VRIVELLLANPRIFDRAFMVMAFRREAGKALLSIRYDEPTTAVSPASVAERMAGEIREAMKRGAAGLIVEPIDDPTVIDLLYQAQANGLAVLTLHHPVPTRSGKTIPCVVYEKLEPFGAELVKFTLEAARLNLHPDNGRIVILQNKLTDVYSAERLLSLTGPLKAAGRSFEILSFGDERTGAAKALEKLLESGPPVDIVLAEDDEGLMAAQSVLKARISDRKSQFMISGYVAIDAQNAYDAIDNCATVVDRALDVFCARAFKAWNQIREGKPVPPRVEVPMLVRKHKTYFVPVEKHEERKDNPSEPAKKGTP
jgi:ABC-type sugar transport system substrate-binding protein